MLMVMTMVYDTHPRYTINHVHHTIMTVGSAQHSHRVARVVKGRSHLTTCVLAACTTLPLPNTSRGGRGRSSKIRNCAHCICTNHYRVICCRNFDL